MELEFDLIGCYPSIANAFRRLMLSDVPSMAIEKVFIYNNTSIIQDEVLAHRIGLVPLRADPRLFEYRSMEAAGGEDNAATIGGTDHDTLEYELKVKCTRRKDVKETASFDGLYNNHSVYSGQIKWLPRGKQATLYKQADVGCIDADILISKMRPGHELDLKLVAVKGVGRDHAKFSPVATAFYRLLPAIELKREVSGTDAQLLQSCFSPNVIGIDARGVAFVQDARYDTCSRNVFRYPHLADAVQMDRVRDHFVFTVESVGALRPDVIFLEAVRQLKKKCQVLLEDLKTTSG